MGCGFVLQSTKTDVAQGRQVATQVEREVGTLEADPRTTLVRQVGRRLLSNYQDKTFQYSFQIVDQAEANAFAAPGGFICVSRGLLRLANTEDDLAGVIAHEIIHVGERHTAKQMAKSRLPGLLMLPGRIVGAVAPIVGGLVTLPFAVLGGGYIAMHSRDHELESDEEGQALAAKAGYDPLALARILKRLERDAELTTGEKRHAGFFDTHPMTPTRVTDIEQRAAKLHHPHQPGIAGTPAEFLHRLNGLVVGEDPRNGVCRQNGHFLHPDYNLFVAFPQKWLLSNSRAALGVVAPDQKAIMALSVAAQGNDPMAPADVMMKKVAKKKGWQPSFQEATTVNGLSGYLVEYRERSGRDRFVLGFLFIAHQGRILQIMWLTPGEHEAVQKQAAFTFRPLTAEERAAIVETRLKVVEAMAGETLAALSQRTSNIWPAERTAVVNGLDVSSSLRAGTLVKIAHTQPYRR